MRILSVDDSAVIRKIIKSTTDAIGYDFAGAEGWEEASAYLKDNFMDVDLILLDWNMPSYDGYQILLMLKADENYKNIPVMMLTTESEKSNIVAAVKAGAINYLAKPFTPQDLTVKILECIGEGQNA